MSTREVNTNVEQLCGPRHWPRIVGNGAGRQVGIRKADGPPLPDYAFFLTIRSGTAPADDPTRLNAIVRPSRGSFQ